MKRKKRKSDGWRWRAPKHVTHSLRLTETTYKELVKQANGRGVHVPHLARYFIEKGLGLEEPGNKNNDGWVWDKLDRDYQKGRRELPTE